MGYDYIAVGFMVALLAYIHGLFLWSLIKQGWYSAAIALILYIGFLIFMGLSLLTNH